MHKIHIKYYILLSVVIVFGVVAGLFYLYGVRPLKKRAQRQEQSISETAESLRNRGWPAEYEKLKSLLQKRREEFGRLEKQNRRLKNLVDKTFRERIRKHFGSEAVKNPRDFRQYVSRLDYQEIYASIVSDWESRDVFLAENLINLSKNTVSGQIYRLILELWSLDTVLNLATENGLTVVTVPGSAESSESDLSGAGPDDEKASLIQLPPVREYYLEESDEEPYLLGFPVVIEVNCTTQELMNFLKEMGVYGSLVVLNNIEIKKQPFEDGGKGYRNRLRVKISCSTFYRLSEMKR